MPARIPVEFLKEIVAHYIDLAYQQKKWTPEMNKVLLDLQACAAEAIGSDGTVIVEGLFLHILQEHAEAHISLRIAATACGFEPCAFDSDAGTKKRSRHDLQSDAMGQLAKESKKKKKRRTAWLPR